MSDYKEDIYLSYRCMSWGWATWSDRWSKIEWDIKDFQQLKNNKKEIKLFNRGGDDLFPMLKSQLDGNIDSWAIRFCYAHYKNNSFCVYPVKSFVNNEGFDGSGVHCGIDKSNKFENILIEEVDISINKNIILDENIVNNFYLLNKKIFFRRLKNLISRFI